jgi:hypothetical protein
MKYNLQLGSCLFTLHHLSHLSYFLYWFYKSLAFSFTTFQSYIHCILLWFVHVFTCKTSYEKSCQYQVIMNQHRGPVVNCAAMVTCIQLYQHWAIHVCNKCGHISFICTAIIIKCKYLVLHVTYFPCWVFHRTQKYVLTVYST